MLGYQRYLYVFARYKIGNLETDKKESDFFAFMDVIEKDGLLLDVGANLGIMTYHLCKRFPDRKVLAIEPIPSNIEVLLRVIEKYNLGNAELVPLAVGDKHQEEIKMVLPEKGNVKMQGLSHVVHDSIKEWNEGEEYTVMSDTLDHIVMEEKVAGIKMDIENYEFFALKGAQNILERDKPVVYLELWENENRDKCFQLLKEFNYEVFVNSEQGLISYLPSEHQKQNFVFIHSSER